MPHRLMRGLLCALATGVVCLPAFAESGERGGTSAAPKISGVALAPRDTSVPRPVVVYLHGICGTASNGCQSFVESTRDYGWLVCPNANGKCPNGGFTWSGSVQEKQRVIERAIEEVAESRPVDRSFPLVLIGFSQGGYVGRDLMLAYPGRYRAALFVGADVKTDAAFVKTSRATKIGFAAGHFDMTARAMKKSAETLAATGFSAQFLSLGEVAHTYVPESPDIGLTALMDWILTD